MILTCPACATSYFIRDDAVGPDGRKVRCQSCGEVWRATPDEPLELTLTPEPVVAPAAPEPEPAPTASLAETPAPELPRAFRARADRQKKLRRAAAHGVVWAGLASIFIGLIVAAFLFRIEIVQAFPKAASAYKFFGATVNPVGLDFEALTAKAAPGHPGMVVVSGAIRNVRDVEIVSPPVRVALVDANGAEVGFKIVQIDAAPVLPGKVQGFAALIPDPGGHGAGIGVDFAPAKAAPAKPAAGNDEHEKAATPAHAAPLADDHAPAGSASSQGLRSATAPGADAPNTAAPIDARPVGAVDKGQGEAVSASHHG
ncbi:MJ0042-type zinc finger domain-containing protein [Brevundimonas sp.]|uniref:MJ0042-type zinc finger domain-containing protein n=1 Tax=Brevundimonas sp. TaxID=1871086 RepID=UPI003563E744